MLAVALLHLRKKGKLEAELLSFGVMSGEP